jgi:peptidoglycan/LPS O-acetylase OafA/YrhL
MGWMRLWLAASVVVGHGAAAPFRLWIDPSAAVLCFYVLSGFTMAMVLERRYQGRLEDFYFNRVLRIYPAYFAVLLATLALELWAFLRQGSFAGPLKHYFFLQIHPGLPATLLSALSQLFLLGMDWLSCFTVGASGELLWGPNSYFSPRSLWHFNFVPQAWTLGVELSFYLLSPLIVKARTRNLAVAFYGGLLLRLAVQLSGIATTMPWLNRFLPLELTVFCGGILAWRAGSGPWASKKAVLLLASTLVLLPLTQAPLAAQIAALPLGTAALLPFLAPRQSGPWDLWAGKLSYPLYICHVLVFYAFSISLGPSYLTQAGHWILPACLALALLLHACVEIPFQRLKR